jgi:Zn-dependent peptidase ImmA (M78 family)
VEVPITPSVLEWAIRESGYTVAEVSEAVEGGEMLLHSWLRRKARPSLTQLKAVAHKLHRQVATFLLPEPPREGQPPIKFRSPLGKEARQLNPIERRFLRRAQRLQDAHAWLLAEMKRPQPEVPSHSLRDDSVEVAAIVRRQLRVTMTQQRDWKSASKAFDGWREAVEALGVNVLLFAMGKESVRGFSLWHPVAPLIAINTAWSDEARIYSLFHELGHLITRSNSACAAVPLVTGDPKERAERWCETFAAAVLLPGRSLDEIGNVSDLRSLSNLAKKYKVSLSAMALQLVHLGKAKWTLLRVIPASSDNKTPGGAGPGRNRAEAREDELGRRGAGVFIDAVRNDVIGPSEALDFLDIPREHLDALVEEAGRGR